MYEFGRLQKAEHGVGAIGQLGRLRGDELRQVLQLDRVAVTDVDDRLLCTQDSFLRVTGGDFGVGVRNTCAAALAALVGVCAQLVHQALQNGQLRLQPEAQEL